MATAGLSYGEHRFGQTWAIRVLVALVVLGIMVGLWVSFPDPRPAMHPTLLWVSIAMVLAYAGLCAAIGKTVLTISDQGVRRESLFGTQEMAWNQILETRYVVTPIQWSAHFGLVGVLVSALSKSSMANLTLTVVGVDGKRIKITSNYRNAKEAIGLILSRLNPSWVAAARSRIQRGETIRFGDLGLSATALTWKKQSPIPLTDLGKAEIVGRYLRIKRTGKWMNAVSARSDKVPNVLVFLEVLESLAPQLKSAAIDPLARVRI
jgi:hypothetical protein